MFKPLNSLIDDFIYKLLNQYTDIFGHETPENIQVISALSKKALYTIAKSNAAYHDIHHTMMVTNVSVEILKSKKQIDNKLSANDWLHFIIAALYHDIGYIRGLCQGDKEGEYIKNLMGETVKISTKASDAVLAPYHVDRAKYFAKTALFQFEIINVSNIMQLIERTRFPVPASSDYKATHDLPGLLRAADLIGQFADVHYIEKSNALYKELEENGYANYFGYSNSRDLRTKIPTFYNKNVRPYISEALNYLKKTETGKIWVDNLYLNIQKVATV